MTVAGLAWAVTGLTGRLPVRQDELVDGDKCADYVGGDVDAVMTEGAAPLSSTP